MKPIEGTDHIMGGNLESFWGNLEFEAARKEMTWGDVSNVEACVGGAEEYRRNDKGVMESRYHVVSSKINGWSSGAKVGDNVVCGSWIDENFLVCPYDDSIPWTPLKEPAGAGGTIFGFLFGYAVCLGAFCYYWRKINEDA